MGLMPGNVQIELQRCTVLQVKRTHRNAIRPGVSLLKACGKTMSPKNWEITRKVINRKSQSTIIGPCAP